MFSLIAIILHNCGYTTPSLSQLILSHVGCLHTLLFDAVCTRCDCNVCKGSSAQLQHTCAMSQHFPSVHTHQQAKVAQLCTSALRGQREHWLHCSVAPHTVTSSALTTGPLESLSASDAKTSLQQCYHKAEIFQLPTGHSFLLPNLAIWARCMHTQMLWLWSCSHQN